MANENIEVGTRAVAKVGRNEISVEVIAVENGSFLVRNDAGREFHVAHLTVPDEAVFCEDDAPNPAPECAVNTPEKKLSLFEAVVTALQGEPARAALNTRELVALAVEKGLWQPSGAKTPEQTLYSAIFRENATKEHPRIVKSDKKGKFIYAGK
jgi:hypothetical protein